MRFVAAALLAVFSFSNSALAWSDVQISRNAMNDEETHYIFGDGLGTGFRISIGCHVWETYKKGTRSFTILINPGEYVGHNSDGWVSFRVGSKPAWVAKARYVGDLIRVYSSTEFVEKLFIGGTKDQFAIFIIERNHKDVELSINMDGADQALDKLKEQCGMTPGNSYKDPMRNVNVHPRH